MIIETDASDRGGAETLHWYELDGTLRFLAPEGRSELVP
jgi:hypothetical protein